MRIRFLLTGPAVALLALPLGALPSCPAQGKERQAAERGLTDPVGGCRVRDHDLSPGRSVRWNGPCRNGLAHGAGVLETSDGAEPADWTEAVFVDGRAEGPGRRGRERMGRSSGVGSGGASPPVRGR